MEPSDLRLKAWKPVEQPIKELPSFPVEDMPDGIANIITTFSETQKVPLHYVAAYAFGAVSSACAGQLCVPITSTFSQPVQLYSGAVGESGTKKSSPLSKLMKPIEEVFSQQREQRKVEARHNAQYREDLEHGMQLLKKKRALDIDNAELSAQINKYADRIADIDEVPFPPLLLTDVTPEAVARQASETDGIAIIATDEGNLINVLTSSSYAQKGSVANIDLFLQGFDSGRAIIARAGIGATMELPCVSMSITVGLQPRLVEKLCTDREVVERGLTARFLLFLGDTSITTDPTGAITEDWQTEHESEWWRIATAIANRFDRKPHKDKSEFEKLIMTDTAKELYQTQLMEYRERGELYQGIANESMRYWLRKADGFLARLAAILSLMEEPTTETIDSGSMLNASRLMRDYFIPCAEYCMVKEESVLTDDEETIWKRLQKLGNKTKVSDLRLNVNRKQFKGSRLNETLARLINKGYIQIVTEAPSAGTRGRSAQTIYINPLVG